MKLKPISLFILKYYFQVVCQSEAIFIMCHFAMYMQKYKDALELQALQEDKAQDQLKIDNEHLLGKIQVRGFTLVSMPEKPMSDDWFIKRMGIDVCRNLVRFLTHVNLKVRAWQCQEWARNDLNTKGQAWDILFFTVENKILLMIHFFI